jgi:hypothetical protein
MHEHASTTGSPHGSEPSTPTSVFLSWSGPDSEDFSMAFNDLLLAIDSSRVEPFHSGNMQSAAPWRQQIKEAVARSHVAVLCLVPRSLSSTWLMYEAGAFFEAGDTYLLACGVDEEALKDTPLEAFQVKDARNRKSVRALVRLLVKPLPSATPAFDTAFDAAWPRFEAVVTDIHGKQESARRRTRLARAAAAPLALLLLAAGIASWLFRVSLQCGVTSDASCADLRWSSFIAAAATAQNPNLAKKVSRRPLAVASLVSSCDRTSRSTDGASLIGPGGLIGTQRAPLIFAASGYDKSADVISGLVLGREGAADLRLGTGCRALSDEQAISVHYIGTLTDDKLCERVREFDQFFPTRWKLALDLTAFLRSLDIPEARISTGDLHHWLDQCGIPDSPESSPQA